MRDGASSQLLGRIAHWMSPTDKTLVVWEVLGEEYWLGADPPRDPTTAAIASTPAP